MRESLERVPERMPEKIAKDPSVEDSILQMREEVYLMGANDSEMGRFNEILGKLQSGEYSAERALKEAHAIKEQKQDYH